MFILDYIIFDFRINLAVYCVDKVQESTPYL